MKAAVYYETGGPQVFPQLARAEKGRIPQVRNGPGL
jgi:hypothetical protein